MALGKAPSRTVANATLGFAIALALNNIAGSPLADASLDLRRLRPCGRDGRTGALLRHVDPETWALDPERLTDDSRERRAVGAVKCRSRRSAAQWMSPPGMHSGRAAANGRDRRGGAFRFLSPAPFLRGQPSCHQGARHRRGRFVISTDETRGARCDGANFGFDGSRLAQAAAFNAKLSEYQAAVVMSPSTNGT